MGLIPTTVAATKSQRPGLDQALDNLREGDTLVVWKLDRLGRSAKDLLDFAGGLNDRGVGFVSLTDAIDTTTVSGRFFFNVMASLAQMERELKAERTAAGRAAAKARGRTGGRPRIDPDKLEHARILYLNSRKSAADVCQMVGIGRRTLFSYLAQVRQQEQVQASP